MYIEARVLDMDTGNTMYVKRFRDVEAAEAFAFEKEDEDTVVKFKLVRLED